MGRGSLRQLVQVRVRQMTRPATSLTRRLNLEGKIADASKWPAWDSPCIVGPKLSWAEGRPRPTRRVLLGELHETQLADNWRLEPDPLHPCSLTNCVNPHHTRIREIFPDNPSQILPPLPDWARAQELATAYASFEQQSADELVDPHQALVDQLLALPDFDQSNSDELADRFPEVPFSDLLEAIDEARLLREHAP